MSKNSVLLAFSLLFFLSCKKGGDGSPINSNYVKSIAIMQDFSPSIVQTLSYNSNSWLQEVKDDDGSCIVYEYSNGQNIQSKYSTSGALSYKVLRHLDADNHIDSITYLDDQGALDHVDKYFYNTDSVNVLSYNDQQVLWARTTYTTTEQKYYNAQGNLASRSTYYRSSRTSKTNMGMFSYGLPSENDHLIDSVAVDNMQNTSFPATKVYHYSYVIDGQDRVSEVTITEGGRLYYKEVYTYY